MKNEEPDRSHVHQVVHACASHSFTKDGSRACHPDYTDTPAVSVLSSGSDNVHIQMCLLQFSKCLNFKYLLAKH